MKKFILSLLVTSTSLLFASGQTRMTLHEEFTGENCPPCAGINPGFWSLCNSGTNPTKLIHITYMDQIPSSGPFYNETIPMSDAQDMYYSVPFAPYGRYDGHIPDPSASYPGEPNYFTQSDINAEAAIASPFNISAFHYFNTAHDSVFGVVHVHAVSAIGGSQLKLKAAFIKTMNFTSSPGTNGETDYENVVRAMFPSTSGQSVATSWATGGDITYTYKGKISGIETNSALHFSVADSGFVVWIQNDSDKSVLQAARSVHITNAGVGENVAQDIHPAIYPNPAQGQATISFNLVQAGEVQVILADATGRTISVVANEKMTEGSHTLNLNTSQLAGGLYIIQVRTENGNYTAPLTVVR